MKFRSLGELKRSEPREVALGNLPQSVTMESYALAKSYAVCRAVADIHGESLEWYGFTLATAERPGMICDIGLPQNDLNLPVYAGLSAEGIAEFAESLPPGLVINGWIHSHGVLMLREFSETDARNHAVVLDYVAARLQRPVAKREVMVRDLVLLHKDRYAEADLAQGSVCIITDAPVKEAVIMEAVYGSFCYAVLVGDGGWHHQEIHTREEGVLTGRPRMSRRQAELTVVQTVREWTGADMDRLREDVARKIRPNKNPPLETLERM